MKKYIQICVLVFLTLAATILFYFEIQNNGTLSDVFSTAFRILRPFVIGFSIAYVLSPMCVFFEKIYYKLFRCASKEGDRKQKRIAMSRGISVLTVLVFTFVLIYAFFAMVIPELISSVTMLTNNIPSYLRTVQGLGNKIITDNPDAARFFQQFTKDGFDELQDFLRTSAIPGLQHVWDNISASFTSILALLIDLVIGIVVSIYIMLDRRKLKSQTVRFVHAVFSSKKQKIRLEGGSETTAQFILREANILNRYFIGFIKGKLIDSLVLGVITGVFTGISNMPYAVLVSVIIGVTNIIPFFGPWIGLIPSTLLILMVNPSKALLFAVVVYILQQIDGNVIGPKILGDATDLDTFWILFAMMVFGGMFGLFGMFIGIPVFGFIYQLTREWVHRRILDSRESSLQEEDE